MNLKTFLQKFRRISTYEAARATYGAEPYQQPQDIPIEERIDALLNGTVKFLLRDILGRAAVDNILTETACADKFRELLPVTPTDLKTRFKSVELPPSLVRYRQPDRHCTSGEWIFPIGDKWMLSSFDERGMRFDITFNTKDDVEDDVLRSSIDRFSIFLSTN